MGQRQSCTVSFLCLSAPANTLTARHHPLLQTLPLQPPASTNTLTILVQPDNTCPLTTIPAHSLGHSHCNHMLPQTAWPFSTNTLTTMSASISTLTAVPAPTASTAPTHSCKRWLHLTKPTVQYSTPTDFTGANTTIDWSQIRPNGNAILKKKIRLRFLMATKQRKAFIAHGCCWLKVFV